MNADVADFFQAPYNTVRYSIIGDDIAPSLFAINPSTGMISYASNSNINLDGSSQYRVCAGF
ncbi:hypothetical protein DPMN_036534 [Dreissena polymorpha]|uniref:Cadherin domain-containing protein n=1 Tax=Dreissena polymorpha TaxID=45954 RepID=A0A9D4RNX4_DREPO|nr:hypothetical protein DPMN_036534 [Dreissena polymorpha]